MADSMSVGKVCNTLIRSQGFGKKDLNILANVDSAGEKDRQSYYLFDFSA